MDAEPQIASALTQLARTISPRCAAAFSEILPHFPPMRTANGTPSSEQIERYAEMVSAMTRSTPSESRKMSALSMRPTLALRRCCRQVAVLKNRQSHLARARRSRRPRTSSLSRRRRRTPSTPRSRRRGRGGMTPPTLARARRSRRPRRPRILTTTSISGRVVGATTSTCKQARRQGLRSQELPAAREKGPAWRRGACATG